MPSKSVQGVTIDVRSLTAGEMSHDRIREWCRDMAKLAHAQQAINRYNSVFIHRVIGASATVTVDLDVDSMWDASLSYATLRNDVELLQPDRVFRALVFKRTDSDIGNGYNQVTMTLDQDQDILVEVDTDSTVPNTNVRLTNNSGGSITVIAVLIFYPRAGYPTEHTPVIS